MKAMNLYVSLNTGYLFLNTGCFIGWYIESEFISIPFIGAVVQLLFADKQISVSLYPSLLG